MNELQIFNNPKFGELRTLEIDGEPWFVANDVAIALGYKRANDAVNQHCKGAAKYRPIKDAMNRIRDTRIISEPDLYRLIINSKLESAEEFECWLMEEVLPAIRKHGAYLTPEMIEKVVYNPDLIINLATQLKEEQEKSKVLISQVEVLEPKAERYEDLTNCEGLFTATELAKDYGMTPNAFNKLLHEHRVQYKVNGVWVPYKAYQKQDYLRLINRELKDQDRTVQQSRWTMKGKEFVYNFFQSLNIHPLYKSNEQLTLN